MIERERIHFVNDFPFDETGDYIVYWMEQSVRSEFNHALEYAILKANELKKSLVVFYALPFTYPGANYRQYKFLLEGLFDLSSRLNQRGIKLIVKIGQPDLLVKKFCQEFKVVMLITDRGYLNIGRKWRVEVRKAISVRMIEIESDVVVPVELVSDKEEFAARTIRPKILKYRELFLRPLKQNILVKQTTGLKFKNELVLDSLDEVMKLLKYDESVGEGLFKGGRSEAVKHLKDFINKKGYAEKRNQPNNQALSNMSPYLRHGHISPVEIALRVKSALKKGQFLGQDAEAFLEEMIVRRELSANFCHFNHHYNSYQKALPVWAKTSLAEHAADKREYIYTRDQFEAAATHDEIWNACQNEMVITGKMHGYMRMYWGKKILEWSVDPQAGFDTAIYLNDKYELDGYDPNGYTGVAWCFGKHDRPWGPERAIFGLVRYMNDAGIKRKIKDWKAYVEKWNSML